MFNSIIGKSNGEYTEKKSKFIANIFYVESKTEAEEKIKEIKKKYFDARHNCSCYRILENNMIIEKADDDGEPAGTAGKPMLNILKKENLCNILVVVTRYFGGILLGTGGLVRAYSNSMINGLENAKKIKMELGMQFLINLNYENYENFKYYCKNNEIEIYNIKYLEKITCNIDIKKENIELFENDVTNKKIEIIDFKKIKEKYCIIMPEK